MATEKWIAGSGQGLTWGFAFANSDVSSLANGSSIRSSIVITNGTALDIFCDISWICANTATTAAPNYLGFYIYPLNEDAATYGDGLYGSAAAGTPPGQYWVGNIGFVAAASTTVAGVLEKVVMPPGSFSFTVLNASGATTGANTICKYRTYNRSVS